MERWWHDVVLIHVRAGIWSTEAGHAIDEALCNRGADHAPPGPRRESQENAFIWYKLSHCITTSCKRHPPPQHTHTHTHIVKQLLVAVWWAPQIRRDSIWTTDLTALYDMYLHVHLQVENSTKLIYWSAILFGWANTIVQLVRRSAKSMQLWLLYVEGKF